MIVKKWLMHSSEKKNSPLYIKEIYTSTCAGQMNSDEIYRKLRTYLAPEFKTFL